MIKTWYVDGNHNLYRTIPNVSGAQIFTGTTKIGILLTVSFQDLTAQITTVTKLTKQACA